MPEVIVYTKPDKCVQCDAVKRWLLKNGVPYEEKNALDHMDYLTTLGIKNMPIVEVEGKDVFGGFNIDRLQRLLAG